MKDEGERHRAPSMRRESAVTLNQGSPDLQRMGAKYHLQQYPITFALTGKRGSEEEAVSAILIEPPLAPSKDKQEKRRLHSRKRILFGRNDNPRQLTVILNHNFRTVITMYFSYGGGGGAGGGGGGGGAGGGGGGAVVENDIDLGSVRQFNKLHIAPGQRHSRGGGWDDDDNDSD